MNHEHLGFVVCSYMQRAPAVPVRRATFAQPCRTTVSHNRVDSVSTATYRASGSARYRPALAGSYMTGIFISYRRVDSRTHSGRFFDRLARHFGRDRVFMDVEGGIARGDDFAKTIEGAVASVGAMVVVIGRQWSTGADAGGARRLDNPYDWVRQELTVALNRGILVMPVLVDGASCRKQRSCRRLCGGSRDG